MGYYSFVVLAQHPVGISHPLILLDTGVNAFTAQTDDLEELKKLLVNEDVEVLQVNQLDIHEQVPLTSLLLPEDEGKPALEALLSEEAEGSS